MTRFAVLFVPLCLAFACVSSGDDGGAGGTTTGDATGTTTGDETTSGESTTTGDMCPGGMGVGDGTCDCEPNEVCVVTQSAACGFLPTECVALPDECGDAASCEPGCDFAMCGECSTCDHDPCGGEFAGIFYCYE